MRILLYTLALAVLPILAQANSIERSLEGTWINNQTQTTMRVRAKRYGLKIKGLFRRNRTTKFRRSGNGRYIDNRGNELFIKGRNRLVLINRNNGQRLRFNRPVVCGNEYRYGPQYFDRYYQDQYYNSGDRYYGNGSQYVDENYSGGYYKTDGRTNQRRERRSADRPQRERNTPNFTPNKIDESRLNKIEGTWQSEVYNRKSVIVVSTRDGIKVKDTTNDKWHRYRLSTDGLTMTDDKGNSYQIDNNHLYWVSKDRLRIVKLIKKSSATF